MKMKFLKLILLLLLCQCTFAQSSRNASILKTILTNYYKNEKVIYKGRNQLLFVFCDKSNNNEEIFETVNQMKLSSGDVQKIKSQVLTDTKAESWTTELDEIYTTDTSNLKTKINSCLNLEQYHEKQKRFNLNNQRLMIVSKPVFYSNGTKALVKVVFYRSIEHNNGSVLLMEKSGNEWVIKDFLNPWST